MDAAVGYTCHCGKSYSSQSSLCRHKRTHGDTVYTCSVCNKTFYRSDLFKAHQTKHEGDKHLCQDCGKSFSTSWYLRQHVQVTHRGMYNFQCDVCDKKCTTRYNLEGHKIAKHGMKPFECDTCHKKFTYRLTMNRLRKYCEKDIVKGTHTCTNCQKTFKDKKGLRQHMNKHTTAPKCMFDICGKQFKWKSSYTVHRKSCNL